MASVIVIFDFDSTIIECDSDNWVLDEFGLTEKFYQLLPNMLWNPLMVFFTFYTFIFSNTMLFYLI
jgi:pyridoxal phosphate phosphatase PHOSPHO2